MQHVFYQYIPTTFMGNKVSMLTNTYQRKAQRSINVAIYNN